MPTFDTPEPVHKSRKRIREEQGFTIGARGYHNTLANVLALIGEDDQLNGLYRLNELTNDIEYAATPSWNERIKKGQPLSDGDITYLKGWFCSQHSFEPTTERIREALFLFASKKSYHPIKKYLAALEWDKKKRLDSWFATTLKRKNDAYLTAVGRKLICSMIHRIMHPGCQMDYMIILEGKEGIYKTTMLKILAGNFYAPFTGVTNHNFEQDAVSLMRGKWLLELAELAAVRKVEDFNRIKAFISCTKDRVRLSYRRDAEDFERHCVLVGTLNPEGDNQYFRDPGENRRFWPVECEDNIDIAWLKEHRDQLFAEALYKEKDGPAVWKMEKLYLDNNDALKIAIEKQQERKPGDAWDDIVREWLGGKTVVTPVEIAMQALSIQKEKINLSVLQRIGRIMRRLRWEIRRDRSDYREQKIYIRPDVDINKILTEQQATLAMKEEQVEWSE